MTTTSAPSRKRSTRLATVAGLLILGAIALGLVFSHRQHTQLPEVLRTRAGAAGVVLRFGAVQATPWRTTLRAVEVEFARVPGLKAVADTATLHRHGGGAGLPEVAVEHLTVTVPAGALVAIEELAQLPLWRELSLDWRRLTVRYENRLVGAVLFDDVRLQRTVAGASPSLSAAVAPLVVSAGSAQLGSRRWENVVLGLRRRGQMLEVGLGSAAIASAPVVLGFFAPQGPAATFIGTLAHPPAPLLARALGLRLAPGFEAARIGGSLSFAVFDDPSRPVAGTVELIASGWPSPAAPDAAVILGKTVGFGARLVPAPDGTAAALEGVRVSTSLFSLFGAGRLQLQPDLRLTLDLSGSLTCAQIRGNLPPSDVRDAVSKYLDGPPKRAAERATMRIQLDAALTTTEAPRVDWKLDAACGLAGF